MKSILQTLDDRKNFLRKSQFCTYLYQETAHSISNKLSFAPAMLFFAMGFKDILNNLRDDSSNDEMQKSVNIHCKEDSDHWRWYLNDLMRIPLGKDFLSKDHTQIFEQIWSEKYVSVRDVVYRTIHLSQIYTQPFLRLIIIESLEGTFECFNEPVFKLVASCGLDEELEYFGQVHAHSEANHAMDKSSEGHGSSVYLDYQPDDRECSDAIYIINTIFDTFERVFNCWYHETRPSKMDSVNI